VLLLCIVVVFKQIILSSVFLTDYSKKLFSRALLFSGGFAAKCVANWGALDFLEDMVPPKVKASEILGRMKRQDAEKEEEDVREAAAGEVGRDPTAAASAATQ
jgi:hypothetical protein